MNNPLSIYTLLASLLDYPEQELLDALGEIDQELNAFPDTTRAALQPLLALLDASPLIELQENYVATFDRNPAHSLHLFEHVHGESRDRGQAMVDLLDEYRRHGLEMATNELPDHVPLFLEVLGNVEPSEARTLLDEAIHVLAALGDRLARDESPYARVFTVLRSMTDVVPQAAEIPPIRDMDEALERFGPGADGVEPLLAPSTSTPMAQPMHFHPRPPATAN
ncbi:nitrate reductase [Burkholderia sp. Leaf177]|uniref:nitrate reductase molybdenum cofactor assembly chaperone n=1 Tax=Burkholderia sp. Leaf177 TaxID=1736287 RepID=UPI0006F847EE|nr:nitrate reductase molybdenum cofactor assembly chaperone [Burkholderia sp. Leaf177]KQR73976.1 nitrate reductase [Burkholderia sp. Leaf177]